MMPFPRPDPSVPGLAGIAEAWALSASLHEWNDGASESSIIDVEKALGRSLPIALRAIYRMSDGFYLLEGNLNFVKLQPTHNPGLATYSDQLREWEWTIPEELVVFGDNGSDELFGLWLPTGARTSQSQPVIEVGETDCFAIVGTDLCRFLRAWTAYYIFLCLKDSDERAARRALQALAVPDELQEAEPDDELFRRLFEWSDSQLPDYSPDPYDRGVSIAQLRERYGTSHRA